MTLGLVIAPAALILLIGGAAWLAKTLGVIG